MLGFRTDSGSKLDFPLNGEAVVSFLLSLKWTCRIIFLLNSLNDCNVVCVFTFFGVTTKFRPLFKTFSCNELSFRSLRLTILPYRSISFKRYLRADDFCVFAFT